MTTTNPVVTTETAQATLEAGGYQCPRCFAQIVKRQSAEHVENAQYEEIVCPACELRWTNVWELTRLLVFGQGEDPDTFTLPVEAEQTAPSSPRCAPAEVRTDPDLWTQGADGAWQKTHATRTLGEVWDDIMAALPAYGIDLGEFDYAGPVFHQARERIFPYGYRWLTCFAVRGDSEGWYVHVVTVRNQVEAPVLETLYLAKTFSGWESANALVHALTQILDN